MTNPPKDVGPNETHVTIKGKTWNQFSESIKHRTPKSGQTILVKEGPDGVEFEVVRAKGTPFGGATFDPPVGPGSLPPWFLATDLRPVLNAHFENSTAYEWDTVIEGVPYPEFRLAGGYCDGAEFWVTIYSTLSGPIDCRMPSNDGKCVVAGKTARVQVGDEWLDWLCTEADAALLECTLTLELQPGAADYWQTHDGTVAVPPEMLAHCEPGTIQAVTAHGPGIIATAEVKANTCEVLAATPPGHRGTVAVTLRLSGVRRGMPEIWPRTSPKVAAQNARHYSQAH